MSKDFVEKVKRDTPIESYISRFVNLKRIGKRYSGLCPFHNEKTPSFSVSIDLQLYHCFGCGRSGDLFKFVMEFDRVDFNRAKEILSEYSGIPIGSYFNEKENEEKIELFALNQRVAEFYRSNLSNKNYQYALDYVKKRNISETEINFFSIGYSPAGYDQLLNHVLKNPKDIQNALKLGLLKENQNKKGQYYDFFRDRIMFPIKDVGGKVVGFGGRILQDKGEQKYINSPASIIYDKGRIFFNLNNAVNSIKKTRKVVLVEGYLDVIGLVSKEHDNVVAPLGTALTESQLRVLKNYADHVTIMLDGDMAGRKAAMRASILCIKEGMDAGVVVLENGIDPFDLATNKTRVEIELIISKELNMSQFLIGETLQNVNINSNPEEKRKVLENMFLLVKNFPKQTDREMYLEEAGKKIGLTSSSVLKDFSTENKFAIQKADNKKVEKLEVKNLPTIIKCERSLLALLILHNGLYDSTNDLFQINFLDVEVSAPIWGFIYEKLMSDESISPNELITSSPFDESIIAGITPYLMNESEITEFEEIKNIFLDLVYRQKELFHDNAYNELSRTISTSSKEDESEINKQMIFHVQEKNKYHHLRRINTRV